jgi:L-alanine-DL-glutamate epimerase-like enolase superfamily enzyme
MVGCMVGTSLGMAPATLVGQRAKVVDLDGPLLLRKDRDHGIRFDGSVMFPPPRELWG